MEEQDKQTVLRYLKMYLDEDWLGHSNRKNRIIKKMQDFLELL